MVKNKDFLRWEVKPVWTVSWPSLFIAGSGGSKSIEVFGVNRASADISRNWEVIHSVEQFNQGYARSEEHTSELQSH